METNIKYGILVGRFQPFHLGHEMIVRQIINDGRVPVIFVGSINVVDKRNPIRYIDRVRIIQEVFYKHIKISGIEDKETDVEWFQQIIDKMHNLGAEPSETPFYLWQKDNDLDWSEEIRKAGFWIQRPGYQERMTEMIHAKDIREDLEGHKMFLHPYVYNYIKLFGLL